MGKPTRNEILAEYYLHAAGVAAVWIDADVHVGAYDVAAIEADPDRTVYCCVRGVHFTLASRLHEWKQGVVQAEVAVIAAKLEELAELGGVGLTPHAVAADRALAAVAADKMSTTCDLMAFKPAFKEARKVVPTIRYFDYLHSRKAPMLETLALEVRR